MSRNVVVNNIVIVSVSISLVMLLYCLFRNSKIRGFYVMLKSHHNVCHT